MKYFIYTDGGARGNPGPSGIGFVIQKENGETFIEGGKYIGNATNNAAEYQALLLALQKAKDAGCGDVEIYMDSQLIVRQMTGQYKIKDQHLKVLAEQVKQLLSGFSRFNFTHIPREQNRRADFLVNQALDKALKIGDSKTF